MAQAGDTRRHLLEQGDEVGVDEDCAVVGVVHDERQLVGRQPHVEGVQHPAGAGHPEVGLEVPKPVPRQGGDPLAGATPSVSSAPVSCWARVEKAP